MAGFTTSRRALGAFVVASAAAAGCFASLDGFSGGPEEAEGGDAPSDVGADAASDTSPPVDGAGADADARLDGPTGFCATLSPAPTFCDDLDDGTLAKWIPASTGTVTITASDASAPFAMRANAPPNAGFTAGFVTRSFPTAATKIHQSFDMRINALPHEIEVNELVIVLGVQYYISIYIGTAGETGLYYEHQSINDAGFFGRKLVAPTTTPIGVWRHYDLAADLTAASPTITFTIASVTMLDHVVMDSGVAPAPFSLQAGIAYVSNAATPCEVDLDNVVVDVQ